MRRFVGLFISALFVIAKYWKQSKWPYIEKWLNSGILQHYTRTSLKKLLMSKYSTYSAKKKKNSDNMASPTQRTWVWEKLQEMVKNRKQEAGEVLQSTGSQRIGHNLATEQQENLTSLSNIWVCNSQEHVTKVELRQQVKRPEQNFSYDPHCPSSVHRRTSVCRKTGHNTFRWPWIQTTLWIPAGNQQGKRSSQNTVGDSR